MAETGWLTGILGACYERRVLIRPATPADMPYVLDSLRQSCGRSYRRQRGKLLAQALINELAQASISIATEPAADPDYILGWCAVDKQGRLLYVYTRFEMRRNGIASELVSHAGCKKYTVRVRGWQDVASAKHGLVHEPFDVSSLAIANA